MFLKYTLFEQYNLIAFTTTANGGVSKGNYSTLNLSLYSGDSSDDVFKNRALLSKAVGIPEACLAIPYQTHDDRIKIIDSSFLSLSDVQREQELHGIDALITQEKNFCIGITTADCVPILIYDPINHVLGAAHAGWKGTVFRIGAKMVQTMEEQLGSNPSELIVGIGPSISPQMFEVGDEVGDAFASADFDLNTISFRNQDTGKLHIDLWQANKEQLLHLGVKEENIEISGICTHRNKEYFSARRQTIHSGRMVTGGVLK